MSEPDREQIKSLLHDVLSGYTARSESQYAIIENELKYIKEQTTRTNSRTTELEKRVKNVKKEILNVNNDIKDLQTEDKLHILECPVVEDLNTVKERIEELERVKTRKEIIKNIKINIVTTIVSMATILGALYVVLQIFNVQIF